VISFHYKTFFQVASNLSFSKAAENLFISQPAVSKNIKKLESELNVALFERRGSNILLTEAGQKLLEYVRKAASIEQEINLDLSIIKDKIHASGELKVGASTTISLYVLPKVLSAFHKKFPKIKILLVNRNSENILKALDNYEIDLAVVEGRNTPNSLETRAFIVDEIIPVCAYHSPYALSGITIEELVDIPLIMRERGSGTQSFLAQALTSHGLKMNSLNIIARLGGTEAMKNYILEDVGIGFLSRRAVEKELNAKSLREVHIKDFQITRQFTFAIRMGEDFLGMAREFIKIANSHYNN
jgi:DNA-binding transcriptional LysR family regulator